MTTLKKVLLELKRSKRRNQATVAPVFRKPLHDPVRDRIIDRYPDLDKRPSRYRGGQATLIIGHPQAHEYQNYHLFIVRVSERAPWYPMRTQAQSNGHKHSQMGKRYRRTEYRTTKQRYDVVAWSQTDENINTLASLPTRQDAEKALAALVTSPINV
jgi:hypothetical protein